jgi:hypothetical protein
MRFTSAVTYGPLLRSFTQLEVKNEPMLFNCDTSAAAELGGPITRDFLSMLDPEFRERGIVDTRVHMLMPSWYPCIPGWHHDDVPRSTRTGQPNYLNPQYTSRHCMALINGSISPTEFLLGDIEVPKPDIDRVIYKDWDDHLEGAGRHQGSRISAPDHQLLYFDMHSFHRGSSAVANGWRWFGRVSIDTERKPTNEVRQQVQVYLGVVNSGW